MERAMGSADPYLPAFSRPWPVHLFDWGAGNPDAVYRTVLLADDATYRLRGTVGNADFMCLEFYDGERQTGALLGRELDSDASGQVEVFFGPTKRPGQWFEIAPGTNGILMREFFVDWAKATPSQLEIQCLDPRPGYAPVLTADYVEGVLAAISMWMRAGLETFGAKQAKSLADCRNSFDPVPNRPNSELPHVLHGFWDLAPDECLLVEMPIRTNGYWGMQLASSMWVTLDHASRQTSLNATQALIDSDQVLRTVISHRDPGVRNWLDTLGHRQGAILLRYASPHAGRTVDSVSSDRLIDRQTRWMEQSRATTTGADQAQIAPFLPTTQVMPLDAVRSAFPPSHHIDDSERRAIITERFRQVTRLQRA
jgi:hypothetical protein